MFLKFHIVKLYEIIFIDIKLQKFNQKTMTRTTVVSLPVLK